MISKTLIPGIIKIIKIAPHLLLFLVFLAACTPVITEISARNLDQGQIKQLRAELQEGLACRSTNFYAQYKRSGDPPTVWNLSDPPTRSAGIYTSDITGSDTFRGNETYDFQWVVEYEDYDPIWGIWPRCRGFASRQRGSSFTVIGPYFRLNLSPDPLNLSRGSSATLTISVTRGAGFTGAVSVSLSGLPNGVTANPSPLNISGSSATTILSAGPTVVPGQYVVTASGSAGTLAHQKTFTLSIPLPSVSSVVPNVQAKGGAVTISGANFDPACGNNVVTIGGINVIPAVCSATSLYVQVPQQAAYGRTQITVSLYGQSSNPVPFTVARQPGDFVDITYDVLHQRSTNRICPTGAVKLEVADPSSAASDIYAATFRNTATNAVIGSSIAFHRDSSTMVPYSGATPQQVLNLGGAGFSLCSVGIVMDADATSYSSKYMAFTNQSVK